MSHENATNNNIMSNQLFFTQAFFTLVGITFCCTMLFMDRDVQVYSPILFSLIATWYPAPRVAEQANVVAVNGRQQGEDAV